MGHTTHAYQPTLAADPTCIVLEQGLTGSKTSIYQDPACQHSHFDASQDTLGEMT